jgi:hypothetical protein
MDVDGRSVAYASVFFQPRRNHLFSFNIGVNEGRSFST